MKLLALLLLVANVAFFGWRYAVEEEDRQAALRRNPPTPAGVPRVQVLPPQAANAANPAAPTLERIDTAPAAALPMPGPSTEPPRAAEGLTTESAAPLPVGSGVCVRNGPFVLRSDAGALIEWARPRSARLQVRQEALPGLQRYALYLVPVEVVDDAQAGARRVLANSLAQGLLLGVLNTQAEATQRATQVSQPGYQPLVVPRLDARAEWFVEAELADGFEDIGEIPPALLPGGKVQQVDCAAL